MTWYYLLKTCPPRLFLVSLWPFSIGQAYLTLSFLNPLRFIIHIQNGPQLKWQHVCGDFRLPWHFQDNEELNVVHAVECLKCWEDSRVLCLSSTVKFFISFVHLVCIRVFIVSSAFESLKVDSCYRRGGLGVLRENFGEFDFGVCCCGFVGWNPHERTVVKFLSFVEILFHEGLCLQRMGSQRSLCSIPGLVNRIDPIGVFGLTALVNCKGLQCWNICEYIFAESLEYLGVFDLRWNVVGIFSFQRFLIVVSTRIELKLDAFKSF